MKKKNRISIIFGVIFFAVAVFELLIYKETPALTPGMRFQTIEEGFEITEVKPYGICGKLGIEKGQIIIKFNDINVEEFTRKYAYGSNTICYSEYSKLLENDKFYVLTLSNGKEYSFINKQPSFWKKFTLIPLLEKVLFTVGFIFIILGFVSALIERKKAKTSSFIWVMYSVGLTLINSYIRATNTYFYTLLNTVLFDVSCATVVSSLISCINYFYGLVPKYQNRKKFLYIIRWIPFGVIGIKFVWMILNPDKMFDAPANLTAQLMLDIVVFYMVISFIRFFKNIPEQSSVLLRFFVLSTFFALIPSFFLLLPHILRLNYWLSFTDLMFAVLPTIFIPIALTCALIIANRIETYKFCYHIITYIASLIICLLIVLMVYQVNGDWKNAAILMVFISPSFCALLENPIKGFLFPKIKNLNISLTELENTVVLEEDISKVYEAVSKWYIENMKVEFIAFYSLDNTLQRREVYSIFEDDKRRSDLMFMTRERYNRPDYSKKLLQHRNGGISVPVFEEKQLSGYVYVGAKQNDSCFTPNEVEYLYSILNILCLSKKVNGYIQERLTKEVK